MTTNTPKYPRISRPVELLRPSYDVVVIGSGYGGGVAASRMARGRQTVCVLERGKERWPGEYPSNIFEAAPQVHVSGQLSPDDRKNLRIPVETGDPTGLYHLVLGQGQNAFVANGLGGTSLLNANIFLRADRRTLALKAWPAEISTNVSSLDPFYERAEQMLEPSPYPADSPPLKKLQVFEQQARQLGIESKFYRPPQTTKWTDGPNSTGVQMKGSTLSGQDSTGVNDGSKTTTLVTYLSDAWNWGAEIFCECEARFVQKHPSGQGYLIFFAWHGGKREKFGKDAYRHLMWVHAKKVVFVGAGAIGTTELMLRSKQRGLSMNEYVGHGMSGNGDILAFGYNLESEVNGLGREQPIPARPIGPTIAGIIDCRDTENPLDGFVIEEGALASSIAAFIQPMLELLPNSITRSTPQTGSFLSRAVRRVTSRTLGPYAAGGSVQHTQTYLVMSHDSNQAVMTLDPETKETRLNFQGVGRAEHVKRIGETLAGLGGTFVQSPFYTLLGQAEITVHAIGGMNLGKATNHLGQVLDAKGGVHQGLVVADGALVPTALGVNPLATITALAERAVHGVANELGITIQYEVKNGILDLFGKPQFPLQPLDDPTEVVLMMARKTGKAGISFTQLTTGFINPNGDIEDFSIAADAAESNLYDAQLFLTANAFDEDALLNRSDHPAMLTGTLNSALPGSPHMITRGKFGLFTVDDRTPDTKNLLYDFDMVGTDGSQLHFHGFKIVNNAAAFSVSDIWREFSTLFVTITRSDNSGKFVSDFVSELLSVTTQGSDGPLAKAGMLTRLVGFFSHNITRVFFAPLAPFTAESSNEPLPSKAPPKDTFNATATDGVESIVKVWEPTSAAAGAVFNILFIPGAAADDRIFSISTIPTNAVEYFTQAGYRCFTVSHRVGRLPNTNGSQSWTAFDARLDIKATLDEVLRRTGDRPYVIAHGLGSVALACGLLDGTIEGQQLRGITASNVFMHPILDDVNRARANLPLPHFYSILPSSTWFSFANQKGIAQRILDQALRFYPVGAREEICSSRACHRSTLAFGRLWSHKNLNTATHDGLHNLLGGTTMTNLKHFVEMGKQHVILRSDLTPILTPPKAGTSALDVLPVDPALARLRGLPILLFSGSENAVYEPESTDVSYTLLRTELDPDLYERVLFVGRGHLDSWISPSCADDGDVYSTVLGHVDAVCRRGATGTNDDGISAGERIVKASSIV
ncbi:FAD/NAD(P)-binding domain-containing protein [Auriculariales sp. MPI-PUGE-AT-0066]|nr:FAD/NAD(P)-binding domain-containing protein [Auriculariales sp. MPI-PUGE-AT-0066]